jgi:hypothetical protein
MPRAYGVTNAAPYAAAPTVGPAGDTYFNTTTKTLYLSDGTTWLQSVRTVGTGTDFNALTTSGFYSISGSATNGPAVSSAGVCTVIVETAGSNYVQTWQSLQIGAPLPGQSTQTWGPWARIGGGANRLDVASFYNYGPVSTSGGSTDSTAFNFTPRFNGWAEVTVGVFYYGFAGATLTGASVMLYTNSVTGDDGAAFQTPVASAGGVPGATWGKGVGPTPLIVPVTAATNYIITLRVAYSPSTTNCYFHVPCSLKVYAT